MKKYIYLDKLYNDKEDYKKRLLVIIFKDEKNLRRSRSYWEFQCGMNKDIGDTTH